jgi:hypothetical protein
MEVPAVLRLDRLFVPRRFRTPIRCDIVSRLALESRFADRITP